MSVLEARDGIIIGPDADGLDPRPTVYGVYTYVHPESVNLPEHFAAGAIETVVFSDVPQAYVEQSQYFPRIPGNLDLSVLSCENTDVGELTMRVKNMGNSEFNGQTQPIDIVITMFRFSPFEEES